MPQFVSGTKRVPLSLSHVTSPAVASSRQSEVTPDAVPLAQNKTKQNSWDGSLHLQRALVLKTLTTLDSQNFRNDKVTDICYRN
jgi:hypothetical protein